MATNTSPYVVGQGEHLTGIAYAHGVSVDDIWNDASNAKLRDLRQNPDVLAEGDTVYIPVKERQWSAVGVGDTANMVGDPTKISIELYLTMDDSYVMPDDPYASASATGDESASASSGSASASSTESASASPSSSPSGTPDGKNAFAGKSYRIEGLPGDPKTDTIGPDGKIAFEAPATAKEVLLVVDDLDFVCPLKIGALDPVTEPSGLRQRLVQLGYTDSDDDDCDLTDAISAFQQVKGIEVTGKPDDTTTKALVEEHGV
jgi:hypothetical protein